MTKVVNFFAGPGTGKSTTTALTFGKLKMAGHNVEIAHEFAKDLTWEQRGKALKFQPYITGKQMFKVQRLLGEVEAVLTDSPILFGMIYGTDELPQSYYDFLVDQFDSWDTFNIFLKRNPEAHPYNPKGRNQTEEEAQVLDDNILCMLEELFIPYTTVPIMEGEKTAEVCFELIREAL